MMQQLAQYMMQQIRGNSCTHTLSQTHSTHDATNNSTEELPDSQDIRKSQVATRLTTLPLNLLHTMTQFTTYNDYAARPAMRHCTPRASFTATQRKTVQHTVTHCTPGTSFTATTATHCNTLQHTATHCNTLQHTALQELPFPVCSRRVFP